MLHKILHTIYLPIQLVGNVESFIALWTELTKLYAAFNHGNLKFSR